jgi:hypothetical protein
VDRGGRPGAHEPPPAAVGIVFGAGADGARSTLRTGAAIVAAALSPASTAHAADALGERDWRRGYPRHVRRLVEDGLADGATAIGMARAGLDEAWRALRWTEADGAERPLAAAFDDARLGPDPFRTVTVRGTGDARPARWHVPYRGEALEGDALRRRIDAWARGRVIEPGAAAALHRCVDTPGWFDLSDRTLVLLGAASEAGPLRWLARWRANVVAVDVDRRAPWRRIAEAFASGNGTLHAPLRADAPTVADWTDAAGADLLARAPAVARWLRGFDRDLDVAALAYLDGERHVRVAIAMDGIQRALCTARPGTGLAFMPTPTDVFAVSEATALVAMQRWRDRPATSRALQAPLRLAAGGRFFRPNVETIASTRGGARYGVVDSLVLEQGPNYALAKRLQQWRAIVARADGHRVSANVAPSTTTASVLANRAFAAGFAGAHAFGVEAFEPPTTNALMAALWVHDLRCDAAAANPARTLGHPFELFSDAACHGGLWTGAYLPRSALPFAAALGWIRGK